MKTLLLISFSINILLVAAFIIKRFYFSRSGAVDWQAQADKNNAEKTKLWASCAITSNDVVFVGSSLTEGFPVADFFNAKNRGIGGNMLRHLTKRIDQVITGKPRKLFIEIGINDLNESVSMTTIKTSYCMLIDKIEKESPTTHIYIQSVLPRSKEFVTINQGVVELNNFLATIKQGNVTFINTYPVFTIDSHLNEKYTTDGLHLNLEGYQVWREVIKEHIL